MLYIQCIIYIVYIVYYTLYIHCIRVQCTVYDYALHSARVLRVFNTLYSCVCARTHRVIFYSREMLGIPLFT